jgi:hypothetical protein
LASVEIKVREIRAILGGRGQLCSSVLQRLSRIGYHENSSLVSFYDVELLRIGYVDVCISLLSGHIYIQHKLSPERALQSSLLSLPRGIMMQLLHP